jgi:hypothetical protein
VAAPTRSAYGTWYPGTGVGDLLVGVDAAGAHVDQVGAGVGEERRHPGGVVDVPRRPIGEPVGRGDPHEHGLVVGPHLPDGLGDLAGEPDPVLEGAAVVVLAVVRRGREDLVEEVAVGGVDRRDLEAHLAGARSGQPELLCHPVDVVAGRPDGGLFAAAPVGVGGRRGTEDLPPARRPTHGRVWTPSV